MTCYFLQVRKSQWQLPRVVEAERLPVLGEGVGEVMRLKAGGDKEAVRFR